MNLAKTLTRVERLVAPYRVTTGKGFRLNQIDPDDTGDLRRADKPLAVAALATGITDLADLQERLYAQDRWSVLLIFQAIDAAGKDSTIKHVMSGVNPQGCQVHAFKAPSSEELDHDYLWRCTKALPERGRIGIFNRSYYEEVVAVRVHPELLAHQKLPSALGTDSRDLWRERYQDIRGLERYLARNGTLVLKFFLHVSKNEQRKRFLERLDRPEKHWKFSAADLKERDRWKDYHRAYEDAIRETATAHAPWFVVPADHKWFTHIIVAAAIVEGLASLHVDFPQVPALKARELARLRRALARD